MTAVSQFCNQAAKIRSRRATGGGYGGCCLRSADLYVVCNAIVLIAYQTDQSAICCGRTGQGGRDGLGRQIQSSIFQIARLIVSNQATNIACRAAAKGDTDSICASIWNGWIDGKCAVISEHAEHTASIAAAVYRDAANILRYRAQRIINWTRIGIAADQTTGVGACDGSASRYRHIGKHHILRFSDKTACAVNCGRDGTTNGQTGIYIQHCAIIHFAH